MEVDSTAAVSTRVADASVELSDVASAMNRIKDHISRTPVLTSSSIDALLGLELYFKAEVFQCTGSFKMRGATNAVLSLSNEHAKRGVITHSSGNHGAALARAAQSRGVCACVIVPENTPACKRAAIEAYGARVLTCAPGMDAREAAMAEELAKCPPELQPVFIPPYNHPDVIAGQGTMALELLEQVDACCAGKYGNTAGKGGHMLDAVVVPVSGGGMISGVATVVKAQAPDCLVIAAEPAGRNGCADVAKCKAAGELVRLPSKPTTIADGLQGRLGDVTWPIVRDKVDDVLVVTEDKIIEAMRLVFERLKVVVEPSGAAGLAAVMSEAFRQRHASVRRVGVVLCGGNADFDSVSFFEGWARLSRQQ